MSLLKSLDLKKDLKLTQGEDPKNLLLEEEERKVMSIKVERYLLYISSGDYPYLIGNRRKR